MPVTNPPSPADLADALLSLVVDRLERALDLAARADRVARLADLQGAIDQAGVLVRAAAISADEQAAF